MLRTIGIATDLLLLLVSRGHVVGTVRAQTSHPSIVSIAINVGEARDSGAGAGTAQTSTVVLLMLESGLLLLHPGKRGHCGPVLTVWETQRSVEHVVVARSVNCRLLKCIAPTRATKGHISTVQSKRRGVVLRMGWVNARQ